VDKPVRLDPKPVEAPPQKPAEKPAEKPVTRFADKPTDKPAGKDAVRYVVQFGAFADATAARTTRLKAERMGLPTYSQQVETPAGKRWRVRLGPFNDRAAADKALATLRKGGLDGAVLTL
jgi:DedD protein